MALDFPSSGHKPCRCAAVFILVALFLVSARASAASEHLGALSFKDLLNPRNDKAQTPVHDSPFRKDLQKIKAVLTMDGGGLRGIIIVEVLAVVESAIKKALYEKSTLSHKLERLDVDLADYFYAMSGVNSACWIASYLASKGGKGASSAVFNKRGIIAKYGHVRPGSVDGLKVLFFEFGPKIYKTPNMEFLAPRQLFNPPLMPFPRITYTAHPSRYLKDTLKEFLGETTMADLDCILLVPAYDLLKRAAVLFVSSAFLPHEAAPAHTYILETTGKPRDPNQREFQPTVLHYNDKGYRLRDLAHAGSAAATMHSAHKFSAVADESWQFYCIDGALMANNPTLQVANTLTAGMGMMSEMAIISIGTGITGGSMVERADSGAVQWMLTSRDFFTVITDGNSELVQAQMDLLFYFVLRTSLGFSRGQYLRVQTSADEEREKGKALEEVDDIQGLRHLQFIGKETGETFRAAIVDFVGTYIFGTNKTSHQFTGPVGVDPTHSDDETATTREPEAFVSPQEDTPPSG